MKYKKGERPEIDKEYKSAALHGMLVKLSDEVLFYRKKLHWEYVEHKEIASIYRKISEVISHTSCCSTNLDIERLIITKKDGEVLDIHVCDGEKRTADKLYSDLKSFWSDVSFGKADADAFV